MNAVIAGADENDLRDRLTRVARVRWDGPDAMMAERPPGWVIGVVGEVAEQLIALRDAGVSRVVCQHLAPDDLDFVALLGGELAQLVAWGRRLGLVRLEDHLHVHVAGRQLPSDCWWYSNTPRKA